MQHLTTRRVVAIVLAIALALGGLGCLARSRPVDNPTDGVAQGQTGAGSATPTTGGAGTTNPGATAPTTPPAKTPTQPGMTEPKPTDVWLDVDVTGQRVRIMKGETVTREMVASTGTEAQPTPLGTFKIQNRGEWFFSKKYQQGGQWWVSFKDWGVYLFHSVPMDEHQRIIAEEAAKLGQPASHGCVRLSVADAKWIYDNIKAGTRVVVHQ
jgi:lipoprotein-anchoring transpeptidase ErfK/SrfK